MAQVSYGTITITDTNDIERIYVEYCRSTSNQLSGTTVPDITRAWGETTPEWVDGQYIWQRTVVEESGTQRKTYGTPVCISGEKGETGEQGPQGIQGGTGAAGRSLKSTTTHYTTAAATATITQSNMGSYTWSSDVPTYNASTPAYWVRVTNVYENPSSTVYIFYKDNGITDAVKTSHDANSTAASANSTANAANQTANSANTTANNANTKADQAVTNVNNLQAKLKYYWVNEVNHTNGVSGWTKPNYPVGTYAASGISGTTFDSENSSTYGYNTWYANGINLRYNAINLGQLTGTSLTFYHPSTSSQGGKAMELTGSALKFYDSTGSVAQATFGGTQATISGTINVYDGKIGNGSNYWYIGNYTDYNQNDSAIIKSIGTASIQLNETNTWRIATNRIHTAWAPESGTDAYKLHFPIFVDSENNNKHWDFGLHLPTSNSDKFLYIRNAASTQSLDNLLNDLDDAGYNYWTYKFYIDSEGNLHAGDIYSHGTLISGTSAPYLLKSGGTITGDLTVNGTITGTLSGTASNANTVNNLTVQTAVPANAVFTDTKVTQTASTGNLAYELLFSSTADNTTRTEGARKTSTLTYNPSTKALLTGGTINGYTLAAASAKGVDTSLTASSTSANLPTSAAVANLIKQYLPLTGGNVTGAVSFGSSVSADELTVGDLVVNGAASFTNNLQANTINGVAVGSNPKFTDTTYTFANGTNGFTVTPLGGTAQTVTVTPSIANNITGSGTSGYLAKFTGANTIGNGPALGSDTTKFLNNKGEWAVPAGTYTYTLPLAANGTRGGVQIGFTTNNANRNYAVQLSSEKMYVNVPWTDTWNAMTGATSSANGTIGYIGTVPPKDGYNTKYWRADGTWTVPPNDNTHRPIQLDSTEILGNNTTALNLVTGGGIALSNSSGAVTIAHKDTSSQNSSSNSGRTYIQSITLDTYGHVTGLSTATETVTDTHYTTHLYAGKSDGNTNAATTNGNTYLMVLDNTTVRDRRKISGSGAASVTSDASGNITIDSPVALTNVSFANGTITFTKSDGDTIPITTDNFVITQASGATALVKLKSGSTTEYEGYSAGGATTAPVYFDTNGHPVAVTSIPWSLIANKPSSYTPASHAHGNLSNDGKITSTATIASGDKLVIVDSDSTAGSKITGSSITFGTSETTFLTNKGTWAAPVGTTYTFDGTYNASTNKAATVSTVTNAINNLNVTAITGNAGQTITSISETNGKISATYSNISITKSQISDFPTSMTPAAHNHDDRYYTETEIDNRLKKYIPFSHYSNTNGSNSGKYYKISINSYTGWMLNFTVKMYHAYNAFDLQISGYNYGSSHWYSPAAVVLGASVTDAVEVNFGYDSDYHLWVAIPAQRYTGIGVTSFTNGYQQVSSWEDLFTITMVDGLPSTKQSTVTAYRPWYRNETVSNATSATSAGKWTTARNFTIKDSDSTNSGTAVSVDGSAAATLLLPSTIKASLTGNASTATKWASAQTVYVTLGTASTSTTIQGGSSSAQTIGVNGTLAIGNGGTGLTSSPSMLTNLGSTTAANVLQASPRPGITGTLGAANGGTGQTSLINAANSLLNALSTGSSTPVDNDYYISQYVGGGTTTTTYHRRPMSALWGYISGKISSSGTYVTIATDQTITASQKTFNGAIRWGTSSKYGAAYYDSTLEALVFSFA